MADIFLDNIYLIILLPLWIFLSIMVGRFFSVYVNKLIIYILTLFSSACGILLCSGALWKLPADKILETSIPFIKVNDFIVNFGLHIDRLSLIFALVLFLISFCVQLFSISFMKTEKKSYRFYALLNLFNSAMSMLFFSENLFQMYFFWEIVGITSYLLIGFEYFKEEKSLASKKVFIINRIGDTALISAIIFCSYFIYNYAPNKTLATLSFIDMNTISTLVFAYSSEALFVIICLLFIIGAIVKSAQFPFYTWLEDAMEAKLPISALLHSSTLVASGVYLVLRLTPFFALEEILFKILLIIGALTALICSLSACSQTNPKKVLAYSTSAQFGLIFFAIGILNIKAAIAYFIAHAFIKSTLFLNLPKENKSWSFTNFVIFLISGLSLGGILLSGMLAKEMIAYDLGALKTAFLAIISFLTMFYIIRIALLLYKEHEIVKTKPNILEIVSIGLLLTFNILFYIYLHKNAQYKVAECFWSALTAWICVYILYSKNAFWKVPILYPITYNGFHLDRFYTQFCANVYDRFCKFCEKIDLCVFSNYCLALNSSRLGVKLFGFVEEKIMNGGVRLIIKTFKKLSIFDNKIQNKNIQNYNLYAFIIITLILVSLIMGYSFLIMGVGYVD